MKLVHMKLTYQHSYFLILIRILKTLINLLYNFMHYIRKLDLERFYFRLSCNAFHSALSLCEDCAAV